MISQRTKKLQTLCADASAPNTDADRLTAISRAANRSDLGRPTRSFMLDQLKEIESRNSDVAVKVRIVQIREKFAHNRGVKERRLARQAKVGMDTINESSAEPKTIEVAEPVQATQSVSDDDPQPPYPPRNLLFPPPSSVYELGSINMQDVARRMIAGGARDLREAPGRQDVNEAIIRIALALPHCIDVTEGICRTAWLGLQYERWSEDPRMSGRYRYWPRQRLFGAVFYFANATFGYGRLPDAPPNPSYVHELIQQSSGSIYVAREELPRAIAAARLYRHLPGINELLTEIDGGNHV